MKVDLEIAIILLFSGLIMVKVKKPNTDHTKKNQQETPQNSLQDISNIINLVLSLIN